MLPTLPGAPAGPALGVNADGTVAGPLGKVGAERGPILEPRAQRRFRRAIEGNDALLRPLPHHPHHPGSKIDVLDIESDDIDAEAARLEALGAKRIGFVKRWWVMEAPGGQRFCVIRMREDSSKTYSANEWP